jgi:hypothetical protein
LLSFFNFFEHIINNVINLLVFGIKFPVSYSSDIVDRAWPAVSNLLSEIRNIRRSKFRANSIKLENLMIN